MSYSVQAMTTLPTNEQIISTVSTHGKYETAVKIAHNTAQWLSNYSRPASAVRETVEDTFVVENVGSDKSAFGVGVVTYYVVTA